MDTASSADASSMTLKTRTAVGGHHKIQMTGREQCMSETGSLLRWSAAAAGTTLAQLLLSSYVLAHMRES